MTISLPPLPAAPIPTSFALSYAPGLGPLVCTPALLQNASFSLFGGGTATLPLPWANVSAVSVLTGALQNLGLQATPLAPTITLLKGVSAIVNFIVGLPGNTAQAIAFNPQPLIDSVTNVVNATVDIASLVLFPIQLCRMVRGFLTTLINFLVALKAQINLLVTRMTNVTALIAKANELGNTALLANAQCALERLEAKVAAMNQALAALTVVIAIFSILLCLITGGHLDPLPTLDAGALTSVVFDPVIATLTAIRDAIPDLGGTVLAC